MSGLLKGVKKIFKKVGKVLKKIALPALAIGAVVLTGGAALGVFGAGGLSGALGAIGISGPLQAVAASAAKAATMGAVTSAITGGNPIKGATTGLLVGGAIGAAGGLGQKVAGAGNAAANTGALANADETVNLAKGLSGYPTGNGTPFNGAPAASGGLGSGVLSFLNNNPVVGGTLIQGIGSGIIASGQAKAQRKADEREADSYSDTSQLFRYSGDPSKTNKQDPESEEEVKTPIPYSGWSFAYNPNTGIVRKVQDA